MAKKSVQIPVAPEPEVTDSKDPGFRRISTGSTSHLNRTEKILPHYLRASTGSCHDFCKYGRKHAFEANTKLPMLKGITFTSSEGHNLTKTITDAKRKVKPMAKPKFSPDLIIQLSDTPIIKLQSETVKALALPLTKKLHAAGMYTSTPAKTQKKPVAKHDHPPDPRIKVSSTPNRIQQEAKILKRESLNSVTTIDADAKAATALKCTPVKAESPSFSSSVPGGQTGRRNSDASKINKSGASKISQKKALALSKISVSVKPSINRVASLNARKNRATKAEPPKNEEKATTAEAQLLNEEMVSEKTLYVIESKPEIKSLEASTGDGACSSLSSPSSTFSPSASPSLSSFSLMSLHDEEKYIDSESMLDEEDDSISEHDETENQMENFKDEYKKRLRRAATIHPENDELASKLKFRRGKVVDLPSDNNAPRKLKFRKGRILGDNKNGGDDLRRKSFKQGEVDDGDTNIAEAESEKVILRHQDANGKKDAQGLLNNVIEETASKLVETRKSKVKALVGAFETVISLQDGRPATNAT